MKQLDITMDELLNMNPEDFSQLMSSQNMGIKMSLRNLLRSQYEQCNVTRQALVKLLTTDKLTEEDRTKTNKTLEEMYVCMQLIEDRHNIVDLLIKSLN